MSASNASAAMALASFFALICSGCASPSPSTPFNASQDPPLEDVIPLTAANLRGHRMLYNEGWHIITSSKKALEFARERSIEASGSAIKEAVQHLASHSSQYAGNVRADAQGSLEMGKSLVQSGTKQTGEIFRSTRSLTKTEWTYATRHFGEAWEEFIKGNLSLGRRTQEDRETLLNLPGHQFGQLKEDFSNIWDITKALHENFSGQIQISWDAAFERAGRNFRTEYERSGDQPNSLLALGPILQGYLKALYHGGLVPAGKTLVRTSAKGTGATTAAVFLPITATSVVAGRTIQSAGMSIFYTGKVGIAVISPTVESGLLVGLSILSVGAVPVTAVTGTTLGAVNQVAFTASGPTVAGGEAAALTTFDTGKYVGFMAYDALAGSTKVIINQASAGVVLGYNALTALPAHLFMAAEDAAILLAWEGPKLIIVKVTGRLKDKQREARSSPGELPVGTVINLKHLQSTEGITVETLSEDPKTIRDVLEQLPCDLRDGDDPCTTH